MSRPVGQQVPEQAPGHREGGGAGGVGGQVLGLVEKDHRVGGEVEVLAVEQALGQGGVVGDAIGVPLGGLAEHLLQGDGGGGVRVGEEVVKGEHRAGGQVKVVGHVEQGGVGAAGVAVVGAENAHQAVGLVGDLIGLLVGVVGEGVPHGLGQGIVRVRLAGVGQGVAPQPGGQVQIPLVDGLVGGHALGVLNQGQGESALDQQHVGVLVVGLGAFALLDAPHRRLRLGGLHGLALGGRGGGGHLRRGLDGLALGGRRGGRGVGRGVDQLLRGLGAGRGAGREHQHQPGGKRENAAFHSSSFSGKNADTNTDYIVPPKKSGVNGERENPAAGARGGQNFQSGIFSVEIPAPGRQKQIFLPLVCS